MEVMLQAFKNFDMLDVDFLVVNSKTHRSRAMLPELTSRVTFPVYQDTVEDDVWKTLGGRKDDMYIYDRCGRLAYYIPFPLSVIHDDQPQVFTSLLSAYFFIPCGSTCENNSTYQFREAQEGSSNGFGANSTDGTVDVNDEVEALTENEIIQTQKVDDEFNEFTNISSTEYDPILDFLNTHNFSLNNSSRYDTDGEIYMLQNALDYIRDTKALNENETLLIIINEEIENPFNQTSENDTTHNQTESLSHQSVLNETNSFEGIFFNENQEKDHPHLHNGCVQMDRKVCIHWSKSHLKAAQNCCSSSTDQTLEPHDLENHKNLCKNFTRKRCKKLKTIIKCCSDFVTHSENPTTLNNKEDGSDM